MKSMITMVGCSVAALTMTGCLSLGGSTQSVATPPAVQRMEIWVHNVDGVEPVFSNVLAEAEAVKSPGLANGQIELADLIELIGDAQRIKSGTMPLDEVVAKAMKIYDGLPEATRAATLLQVLNMTGITEQLKSGN